MSKRRKRSKQADEDEEKEKEEEEVEAEGDDRVGGEGTKRMEHCVACAEFVRL